MTPIVNIMLMEVNLEQMPGHIFERRRKNGGRLIKGEDINIYIHYNESNRKFLICHKIKKNNYAARSGGHFGPE